MADRTVSDTDTVRFTEGITKTHGHNGHRSRYPDAPGPPPPPRAAPRTSAAAPPDLPRPALRRQVY